ncbi:MAG TPA: hypothetical protein VLT33_34745, partial [Labilithrix sp.]|nr:hypothetical protein [Labilithrix sp.]
MNRPRASGLGLRARERRLGLLGATLLAALVGSTVSQAQPSRSSPEARGPRPEAPLQPGVPQVEAPTVAEDSLPPWADLGDVPAPAWARSVAPSKSDAAFYAEPGNLTARRGSAQLGARLPLFGTKRGSGCQGR